MGEWGPNRLLPAPPGSMVTTQTGGMLILGQQDFNSLRLGQASKSTIEPSGDMATKYLWTIDQEGLKLVLENQPWDSGRGIITHTNMSNQAYIGGEAWRTGPNRITISAASRAYGYNPALPMAQLMQALERYNAAIEIFRNFGLDVTALPFGLR